MTQPEFFVWPKDLSSQQQQLLCDTLNTILKSPYFCKSKRYPALLEYVVSCTLEGNSDLLKERTIGTSIFGRPADYDSACDPIVRIAALEVRKRIELYFSKHPEAPVRIDLPVGSYTARFYFSVPTTQELPAEVQTNSENSGDPVVHDATDLAPKGVGQRAWITWRDAIHVAVLLLFIVAGRLVWRHQQERRIGAILWPVLHNDAPTLAVLGGGADPYLPAKVDIDPNQQYVKLTTLENSIVSSKTCSIFHDFGHDCEVILAQSATLADLHNKSLVVIGAFDNVWTQRLLSPLRYQLQSSEPNSTDSRRTRMIVDRSHPGAVSAWKVGPGGPSSESGYEYAIVGRYHSDITDGMVVMIAGLGPEGTSSAGDYICSAEHSKAILAWAPKDWKGGNFEAVLQIGIIQGNSGHVKVVAAQFW